MYKGNCFFIDISSSNLNEITYLKNHDDINYYYVII